MYKRILAPTDGSDLATQGLQHGLALAKALGIPVTIVTATEMWSALDMGAEARQGRLHPVEDFERIATASASKILERAAKLAEAAGVPADVVHVADQEPAEAIIGTAAEKGCDLIVMASHGRRGVSRLVLGSVAMDVVAHATVPILIVR